MDQKNNYFFLKFLRKSSLSHSNISSTISDTNTHVSCSIPFVAIHIGIFFYLQHQLLFLSILKQQARGDYINTQRMNLFYLRPMYIELNHLCQTDNDLFEFHIQGYEDQADIYIKELLNEIKK